MKEGANIPTVAVGLLGEAFEAEAVLEKGDAPSSFSLAGRRALVTGGSRGLGQAIALSLGRMGPRFA